jgi:hypothetical protein
MSHRVTPSRDPEGGVPDDASYSGSMAGGSVVSSLQGSRKGKQSSIDDKSSMGQRASYTSELLADRGFLARTMYRAQHNIHKAFGRIWKSILSGELLRTLNTIASLIIIFLVPYQAAFEKDAEFGLVYQLGYILDLFILMFRLHEFNDKWKISVCVNRIRKVIKDQRKRAKTASFSPERRISLRDGDGRRISFAHGGDEISRRQSFKPDGSGDAEPGVVQVRASRMERVSRQLPLSGLPGRQPGSKLRRAVFA